tara:strand:- start:778 stop:1770 length:993 start_codon:yes stop_codon:yes gene_type:complete
MILVLKIIPNRFYKYIEIFFEKLRVFTKKYSYNFDREVNLKIKPITFNLFIRKGNEQGHSVYSSMSDNKNIYELAIITCLNSIVRFNNNIIFADLGSFVGFYAIYASKLLGNSNKVHAIESNNLYCEDIKKAINLNNLNNIEVHHSILSDKIEEQIYYREFSINKEELIPENFNNKKIYENYKKFGKIQKTETFDNLVKKFDKYPNLLKIDVHGAEGKIIKGSLGVLKNYVKIILLELHTEEYLDLYSPGCKRKDVINNIIDCDFKCYLISPFRDLDNSGFDDKFLEGRKKLSYREITKNNCEDILYGREIDIFVLSIKKDLDIRSLDCF